MSNRYVNVIKKYDLKKNSEPNANLTFDEVYLLAREVIENINPMYLEEYDKLITSGKLDFSYDSEYFDSHYIRFSNGLEQININREFDYRDVSTLVHEFMHMTNFNKKLTPTRIVLTEFISIYFEEYAKQYLLKKGIEKDLLHLNERILTTQKSASKMNWYNLIMLVYEEIGNLDENSYLFLREYYLPITKEGFEEECKFILNKIEQLEEAYKLEIMYEEEYNDNKVYDRCVSLLNSDYKYIFGTLLAYYALDNIDMKKMVWLNEHLNDEDKTVYDILVEVGIELNEIPITNLIEAVESKIDITEKKIR